MKASREYSGRVALDVVTPGVALGRENRLSVDGERVDLEDATRRSPRGDGKRSPAPANGCEWCGASLEASRRDAKFCKVACRQASWRFGVPGCRARATGAPIRLAYADPPYPGKAFYYAEGCEVDHAALVAELAAFDGWALSTSEESLVDVLRLCPPGVRVAVWVRQVRRVKSARALNAYEPVIYRAGRPLAVDVAQDLSDVLVCKSRFRAFPGALVGMKPPAFAVWVFRLLGALPGDSFADLFPGSGAVTLAWERYTSRGSRRRVAARAVADPQATRRVEQLDASRPPAERVTLAPIREDRP